MKFAAIILAAITGVALIIFCSIMSSKNGAIGLEEEVNTAISAIDSHLTTRFNKLHELAACVKKYDKHESETLVKVIEARGKNMSGAQAKECIAAFSRVEERYPDLKSQANYKFLMNDIAVTENHLNQTRKGMNESIRDYRYYCRKFPTSFILNMTGYCVKKFDMYQAEDSHRDTKPLELF